MRIRSVNGVGLEEAILNGSLPVVVAFLSKFSVPCRHFLPEICAVAECVSGAVFIRIDVDEEPSITEFHKILYTPTTALYSDGQAIETWEGPYSRESLKTRLETALAARLKRDHERGER
jgi:thioredoxin 1